MELLTPGVFVEDIKQVVAMPVGTDPVSAFIGVTASGPVGIPTLVNSWNVFLNTFATGQDTAFLTNSYIAYAVYGFFQNGGKKCYVTRVTDATTSNGTISYKALCATSTGSSPFLKAFSAKTEGAWGNKISIEIPLSGIDKTQGLFTIKVKYNGNVVESWGNLGKGVNVSGCYADTINSESNYIKVTNLTIEAPIDTFEEDVIATFTGGDDGIASSGNPVPDSVYEGVLPQLDFYDEIKLVAIPGASDNLQVKVATYCTNHKYRIAICEGPVTATNTQLQTLRGSLNGLNAVLYAPWIKVVNPLSSSGALIPIPACGHICGVYSRISDSRGFWKSPAGIEANIRGAVSVQRILTQGETDILNPKGINAIIPKTNNGICIWGARSCNKELSYVSDLYMNITLKKNLYDLTQEFVFEPHDSALWTKVQTVCQDYLNSLYQRGALFGSSANEAFYVRCDETLNPVSVRNQGKLIVEVGYATKKPAEFIVLKISHELTTA